MAVFYEMQGDQLLPVERPEALFPFITPSKRSKPCLVSLVGGGGKTTTLYFLGNRAAENGLKVLLMTTTKMARPQNDLWARSREQVECRWRQHLPALIAEPFKEEKIQQPEEALFQELYPLCDLILVEADGSKRLPVKVPRQQEPVILPQSEIILAVAGANGLGQPIDQVCFLPELVRSFLTEELGSRADLEKVTPLDLAKIVSSEKGGRKGVEDREFYVLLNQADDPERLKQIEKTGQWIRRGSSRPVRIVASCYEKEERS